MSTDQHKARLAAFLSCMHDLRLGYDDASEYAAVMLEIAELLGLTGDVLGESLWTDEV